MGEIIVSSFPNTVTFQGQSTYRKRKEKDSKTFKAHFIKHNKNRTPSYILNNGAALIKATMRIGRKINTLGRITVT